MTRDEVKKIIAVMMNTYPNYHPADLSITVDIWWKVLEDMQYSQIENALIAYIRTDTSGFAPQIGQLLSKIQVVNDEMTEMQAWSLVSRALRNGTYGAEEEFKKLPADIQACVGSPDMLRAWAQTDIDSIENVVQSNFMRTYRAKKARDKETYMIPQSVKAALQQKEQVLLEDGKRTE